MSEMTVFYIHGLLLLLEKLPYRRLLKKFFGTTYLDYDPKRLCEAYADERTIAPLIPYKEEACWIQSSLDKTIAAANALSLRRMRGRFALQSDSVALRKFQSEALEDRQSRGHMRKGDEGVVRLDSITSQPGGLRLRIQCARYSDQVQSNFVMDWSGKHGLKATGIATLRKYFLAKYGRRLPPLTEAMLANTVGIAVILYYRDPKGAYRPYLPLRARGLAVFDGGYHCTASGATEWRDDAVTFDDMFTSDVYKELWEEVRISREEVKILIPVALCREFLRGGKPQIFFAGFTPLSETQLAERRGLAIKAQKRAGVVEIRNRQLIARNPKELQRKMLKDPLTLEATANLFYADAFCAQYIREST